MSAFSSTTVLLMAQVALFWIALLALLKFGQIALQFLQTWQESRHHEPPNPLSHAIHIAPPIHGHDRPADMPQTTLSVDIIPLFDPSFSAVQIDNWAQQWQLHLTPERFFLYHHPDHVKLTIRNLHHHGAFALDHHHVVFGIRLELQLPCAIAPQIAVNALLSSADLIAEQLSGKLCAPNSRQRLPVEARETYYQRAQQCQSAYDQWQHQQLSQ